MDGRPLSEEKRRSLVITKLLIDVVVLLVAAPLAFLVRLEGDLEPFAAVIPVYVAAGLVVKGVLYFLFKVNRQSWYRVGIWDLYDVARMAVLSTLVLLALSFVGSPYLDRPVPRSIPFLDGVFTLILLGGVRFSARFAHLWVMSTRASDDAVRRVLIIGAGEAGTTLAREMQRHPEGGMSPIGFLDDDENKRTQSFVNLPVLGKIRTLPVAVENYDVDEVLIAMPSAAGSVIREIVQMAREAGVRYRIMPGYYEILSGEVSISHLKEVDLEDLLRREPVNLDIQSISSYLTGKVVLVTGAGGSIGSELVRQIARFDPESILLFGRGENSIYQIQRSLRFDWPDLKYTPIIGDIQRREKLAVVFEEHQPQVVFHAAAHKHVPLMELNPEEAVFNNILGSRNLVEVAQQHHVERFVNISSDKAVNPTSVMGASKRIVEYLVSRASEQSDPEQVFVSVRFGNVLGSRGSVVPLFRELIAQRKPLTVTHPEMTRYFMTIPEASQLVLQAGGLGKSGSVFMLDMGEPVKILDLAEDLIRLSGLEPGEDIEIQITGIRPGEKLFEELTTNDEQATKYDKIYIVRDSDPPPVDLNALLAELEEQARCASATGIKRVIKKLVPDYQLQRLNGDQGSVRNDGSDHTAGVSTPVR